MTQHVPSPPCPDPRPAGSRPLAIVPRTLEEASLLARSIVASGLARQASTPPRPASSPSCTGSSSGSHRFPPPAHRRHRRRPTLWGDGAMALVRASGTANGCASLEGEPPRPGAPPARCKRRGEGRPIERRFSVRMPAAPGCGPAGTVEPVPAAHAADARPRLCPARRLRRRAGRALSARGAGGRRRGRRWTSPAPLRAPPPAPAETSAPSADRPVEGPRHRRSRAPLAPAQRGRRGGRWLRRTECPRPRPTGPAGACR